VSDSCEFVDRSLACFFQPLAESSLEGSDRLNAQTRLAEESWLGNGLSLQHHVDAAPQSIRGGGFGTQQLPVNKN
jgi:hypothetical protein